MKFIKSLAISLLFGAAMLSCSPSEEGTVGQTTVEFANAVYKTSFGAGTFYVPMIITSDTEAGLNTADVKVSVVVDETYTTSEAGVVLGVADTTGESGDYRITSLDMNFPDYPSYKDKNDEVNKKLYFNETLNKWVKKIGIEIMILNTEPELMEFKLAINTANTTIGAQKDCVIRIEKGPQDRLCGTWLVSDGGEPAFNTDIAWDGENNRFILRTASALGKDLVMEYNPNTEEVYINQNTYIGDFDNGGTNLLCFMTVTDSSLNPLADKVYVASYDKENYKSITFPTIDGSFLVILAYTDNNGQPGDLVGYLSYIYSPSFSR